MHKLLLLTLLALPLAAGPIIGGDCSTGTLAEYSALGSVGCATPMGVRVFDWVSAGVGSPADVLVTLNIGAVDAFVLTSPDWFVVGGESLSFSVGWSYELALFTEIFASASGQRIADGTAAMTISVPPLTSSASVGPGGASGASFGGAFGVVDGSVTFAAGLASAPGGQAQINGFIGYYGAPFSPGGSPIPEPGTMALIGAGMMILFARSRRSRHSM
jgi:hypothetical protein